ncbi:hypothetical protein E4S40_02650 [Algoriphagus kandeliae]|uniref:Uncharacterized protein n=1 Tax=Algoriphagus kandeliae TaxID=2562278 RepID=A0A4Y9R0H6_9BACT|nr:hypothetical protein [Algoriphagus kandeliae]TFV97568.1 hypothetical protein E4S40_02650 [Algoriphagus kandeliae]
MKKFLLIFLCFFALSSGFAQSSDFLLLKSGTNTKSQIRFYPGEQITYKSAKLGYYVTDVIKEFSSEYIYLSENIISPNDILEIDIQNKDRRNGSLKALNFLILGSGIMLLSVDAINSIYQQGELTIDREVGIIGGILVGTGIALLPVRYKTFKNQGRNKLQIIQMRMD